jgi:hypothetical protein
VSKVDDTKLLTTIELARAIDEGIRDLMTRNHRTLKAAPLEVWRDSGVELPKVSERKIALALLRRDPVTVGKDGIALNGLKYQGPPTFARVGDRLEAGWLATRPDFIELFEPDGELEDCWLGRLETISVASTKYARAVRDARTFQVETVERAERRAGELRAEKAVQLRGGVVELPGGAPTPSRPKRTRRADPPDPDRETRVANAPIWKEDSQ